MFDLSETTTEIIIDLLGEAAVENWEEWSPEDITEITEELYYQAEEIDTLLETTGFNEFWLNNPELTKEEAEENYVFSSYYKINSELRDLYMEAVHELDNIKPVAQPN